MFTQQIWSWLGAIQVAVKLEPLCSLFTMRTSQSEREKKRPGKAAALAMMTEALFINDFILCSATETTARPASALQKSLNRPNVNSYK